MKVWSDEELVDVLRGAYRDVDAVSPSAELRACFDSGAVPGTARVVPLPARRRRVRAVALVAAATLVTFGTLAAAGALPGPLQRGVASLARDVGLHLPSPDTGSHPVAPNDAPGTAPLPTATVPSDAPVGPTAPTLPGGTPVPTPTAPTLPPTPTVTLPGSGLPIGAPVPTTLLPLPLPSSPLPRATSGDNLRGR
jgi:hypothetical protein